MKKVRSARVMSIPCISEGVVRVAKEEDGLGVELVRKEELGEDRVRRLRNREAVELRVPVQVLILDDGPDEGPDVEVINKFPWRRLAV